MFDIQVLDCTLRDGGYIVDSIFGNNAIKGIIEKLCKANVDIIEVGFLKDTKYIEGSSNFNNIEQIKKYIPQNNNKTSFVAMIDYGRYDIEQLPQNINQPVSAIRNCFFKKDRFDAVDVSKKIKEKGYDLYVQPVDILGYTDSEILELVKITNEISPYAFSIVDTFGSMYEEDLIRIFSLLNHNLDKKIKIGFHSHNNLQLSFALSQKISKLCESERGLIIDSTLCGMGRGAGNTNTELIVEYLNKKYHSNYDVNEILDLIDIYISPISKEKKWGYSIPYFIAGKYATHVHNVNYLIENHKIRSKDMQNIVESIEPQVRKRYDYDNLEKKYISYFSNEINDENYLKDLSQMLQEKNILILAPGKSLNDFSSKIKDFIKQNEKNIAIFSVNFYEEDINANFAYFSNSMRYDKAIQKYKANCNNTKIIITSNIKADIYNYQVNYNSLLERNYKTFDNSMILLLKLLCKLNVKNISIAGFDGYDLNSNDLYVDMTLQSNLSDGEKMIINCEINEMLQEKIINKHPELNIKFLTPSIFSQEIVLNPI